MSSQEPQQYRIRLQGHLDPQWSLWFDGFAIVLEENGDTVLAGSVIDQAALHGLLKKVRDLGMPIISITPIDSDPAGDDSRRPSPPSAQDR